MGTQFGTRTGRLLDIDLTRRTTTIRGVPEALQRTFVGGRGLATALYGQLQPPGVDPLSPENVMVIGAGPVTGTLTPGASKHVVVTRSPLTGAWLDTYSSGRIGPELVAAGLCTIVVRGRADRPSVLVINDLDMKLEDAGGLWGRDAFDAETALREKFGDEYAYLVIGPAGEHLVRYAAVNSAYFRQHGRGGLGAVFGSKNLKAILVRGSGAAPCHDLPRMVELMRKAVAGARVNEWNQENMKFGTPGTMNVTNEAGMLPTRNFTRGTFNEGLGKLDGPGVYAAALGTRACFGCITPCSKVVKTGEQSLEGPEYETVAMLGSNLMLPGLPNLVDLNLACDRLGLDTISTGVVLGFVMEAVERGMMRPEDLGGLNPRFGHEEFTRELIEKIAVREGIGDLLAEGLKRVAERLGRGAEALAMHCKGMELPGYDPRAAYGCALTFAVNPRGACHRRAWPPLELWSGEDPYTVDGKAAMIKAIYDDQIVKHLLLVCDFPASAIPLTMDDYADYLDAVTGWGMDVTALLTAGERTETLIRLINNREGFSRQDDSLPDRIIKEPLPDGPNKGKIIGQEAFDRMISQYYSLRGWDEEGRPTAATMERLGIIQRDGGMLVNFNDLSLAITDDVL